MPTLRPDSIFSEFAFTKLELIAARTLTHSQICLLQTMYAQLTKEKSSVPLPLEITLDRDYLCKMAEMEGRLSMIQEILDNHNAALKELNDPERDTSESAGLDPQEVDTLATRAAQLVNKQE